MSTPSKKDSKSIQSYFSPVYNKNKRRRTKSSPEVREEKEFGSMEATGGINLEMLMNKFGQLMEEKLSVLPNREDFNHLGNKMDTIIEEHLRLKQEVQTLKKENEEICKKLESVLMKSKSKNLIFWGTKFEGHMDLKVKITEMCEQVLNVDIVVDRAFKLGRKQIKGNPILVELVKVSDSYTILQNAKKLKNTGMWITRDLTDVQRKCQAQLLKVKREFLNKYKNVTILIRNGYLLYEEKKYFWNPNEEGGLENFKELAERILSKQEAGMEVKSVPVSKN